MSMSPPPLVGRAALLAEIVRRARSGGGSALTGTPGLGGTRLLGETYAVLRRSRILVGRLPLAPRGEEGRSDPFLALLDRAASVGLAPGDRGALRASVLALRLRALIIENAHLLDDATGALVVELAREGVAVIANATGPGGMPAALQLLVDEGRMHRTELLPLTGEEVVELAEHLLGEPVEAELAQALIHGSAGRPARLTELIADGVAQHAIVDGDGLWRLAGPLPPPRSLRTTVIGAFAALPPDQRGWIAAVAAGGPLGDDLARRIAAPATITAAEDAGWTRRGAGGATSMSSVPLAAAVLGSLDQRARLAVLRRLARAARAVPRELGERERVALLRWHIELGERPDADEAFSLAMRPGMDDDSRETLLRAAVAGGAPAGAVLAEHLRRTRRAAEALDLVRASLLEAETDAERISLVRVAAMTTGILERRSADALDALDARIAEAGPHRDLLAVRAALLLFEGRPREAIEVAEVVLRSGHTGGFATSFALMQRAMGLRELGRLDRSITAARRFAEVAEREHASPQIAALARWLVPETAVAVGRELEDAELALTAEYDAASLDHQSGVRAPLAYTIGVIRLEQADLLAAIRLLREADAGSGSWREGWQPRILSKLTMAHSLCGALDEARATYDRLQRIECPPVERGRMILAAAQLAAARGDRAEAVALAQDAAEHGRRYGLPLDLFDAEFAAVRFGDESAPRRLLDLGPLPDGAGRAAQRAYAAALVDGDPAAVDAAAIQLWRAGLRLSAIEAAARADELGAADASARLIGWLTRTNGLRLPGVTDRRAGVLTLREREVAMLAAGGASDRAIATELGITLRTAQTHLGRAFTKLGVHRRAELRELVGEP